MEKVWPPLKECVQFRLGILDEALYKYPWEDDEYAFDFQSYYPPIPDELACLRKLLDSIRKNDPRPSFPEDIRKCPFCPLDQYPPRRDIHAPNPADVDILNHPVWDMDPIPCPYHLASHIWPSFSGGAPSLITPTSLEDTKKYLKQVRNSRGYDVDCFPQPNLVYPTFREENIGYKSKVELESTVIKHIELKTGKNYKLEEVLKFVSTGRRVYLVTFTAKVQNDDSAASSETFIATLNELNLPDVDPIMECLLKPDCNAPGPDHYLDFEIQPIVIPCGMRRYIDSCKRQTLDPKLWGLKGNIKSFFAEIPPTASIIKSLFAGSAPPASIFFSKHIIPPDDPGHFSKRKCTAAGSAVTSQDFPLPSKKSQCKGAAEEHPLCIFGKQDPSASTEEAVLNMPLEEKLTKAAEAQACSYSNTLLPEYQKLEVRLSEEQKKNFELKEEVEKWKSQAHYYAKVLKSAQAMLKEAEAHSLSDGGDSGDDGGHFGGGGGDKGWNFGGYNPGNGGGHFGGGGGGKGWNFGGYGGAN